ncbi:MAG TPA: FxsA family protein [Acidimicrobiia bacterium]|jgi:UPF0716 protein FxsA
MVFAALIALPLLEVIVFVLIGSWIGYLPAALILLAVSLLGAYVVKRQGVGVLRRARGELQTGQVPTAHMIDGALLALAGLLLIFPGFVTAAAGLLLLLPPVRAVPKRWVMRKRAVRASTAVGNRGVVVVRSWRRDGPDSGVPPAIGQ